MNVVASGAITDGNDDTAGNNVTAGILTISGDQAVTGIETSVSTLDLATAATSITDTEADGVTLTDSELSGQFDLSAKAIELNTLNAGSNAVSLTATTGAIRDESEAGTSSILAASLKVRAETGISLSTEKDDASDPVQEVAATTREGSLSIINTGGLRIVTLGDVEGVSITGGTSPDDAILLVAKSPIMVDAPITNPFGSVTLAATAALGEEAVATDNIVVNAIISSGTDATTTIDLYAGGSITINADAELSADTTNLVFSTNYDYSDGVETGTISTGFSGGTLSISDSSTISASIMVSSAGGEGVSIENGRLGSDSVTEDYLNAQEPLFNTLDEWSAGDSGALQGSVGLGEITLDSGEGAEVEIEVEEEEDEK